MFKINSLWHLLAQACKCWPGNTGNAIGGGLLRLLKKDWGAVLVSKLYSRCTLTMPDCVGSLMFTNLRLYAHPMTSWWDVHILGEFPQKRMAWP